MNPWELEYQDPKLLTGQFAPQSFVLRALKVLKKQYGFRPSDKEMVDLGCGIGRNTIYLAEKGATISGFDISRTAIRAAKSVARERGFGDMTLQVQDFNERARIRAEDAAVDLTLCIMMFHLLNAAARPALASEIARATKPGGFLVLRTLAKEGDKNAKQLLQDFPTNEEGTYKMPGTGFHEHVFTKEELLNLFPGFSVVLCKKQTGYQTVGERRYARQYWECILQRA